MTVAGSGEYDECAKTVTISDFKKKITSTAQINAMEYYNEVDEQALIQTEGVGYDNISWVF